MPNAPKKLENLKVALEIAPLTNLDKTYCYYSDKKLDLGCRVIIQLGRKKTAGVVWSNDNQIPEGLDPSKIKSISEVIDNEPVFTLETLSLAKWLRDYYLTPLGLVLKAMLPASHKTQTKKVIIVNRKQLENSLIAQEKDFIEKVFKNRQTLTEVTFNKKLKEHNLTHKEIQFLFKEGILIAKETQDVVATQNKKKQTADLRDEPTQTLEVKKRLTDEQSIAVQQIVDGLDHPEQLNPFLLQGVTGSGKTEVYLHAIDSIFSKDANAQILILVPEISLTPQMTQVFYQRFGRIVEIIHSNLSNSQRWASMKKIREGSAKILIGPRSAVLTAFKELKLIIVDEEHDQSYKQQSGMTYNARDVATVRARRLEIPVVLGSATPSLESYSNALSGRYTHLRLLQRVHKQKMPSIEIVRTKPSFLHKQRMDQTEYQAILHKDTIQAIGQTLENTNQVMIIVGRRGYANYLFSESEGGPITCNDCSITLTFHKKSSTLVCHYCSRSTSLNKIHKKYQKDDLFAIGFGSEKLEQALENEFPNARIARLDSDQASKKGVLDSTLNQFKEHQLDILVGTQMLTKGHDFSKVQLVVLLELDNSLFYPDFRSAEKTFQSLVQSAGRSGRSGEEKGLVIIQSFQKKLPIFDYVKNHDFDSFAVNELNHRKLFGYPPYKRMCKIEFTDGNLQNLNLLKKTLDDYIYKIEQTPKTDDEDVSFLGPSYPFVGKLNKKHRLILNVLGSKSSFVHKRSLDVLRHVKSAHKSITTVIDVDPQHLT